MGTSTPKIILIIIFMNIINGISVDTIENNFENTIVQTNIDDIITKTTSTADKYSEKETYTNIQNTGIIAGTAPSDPVSMGLKIVEIMWKGLTPIILTQNIANDQTERIGIYVTQLFQGIMYILIILTLYQLLHNKKTD